MGLINNLPFGEKVPLSDKEIYGIKEEKKNKTLVEIGLFNTGQVFVFKCPICGKTEINDQRMELACTGPGSTDEHPLEPMEFVGIKPRESVISVPRRLG